ncbi:hypothetical protein J5X84_36335 [Streptosporangiaceae bacterium NEAU-GS5]|nr:hypothetical protein [Streptosporangiaceae bacterium NEAU-GS5]
MTAPALWGVEVNEVKVFTYGGSDSDRWIHSRARFEPLGRVITLKAGFPADEVFVACEGREDAADLAAFWHESGMVHKRASKVRQLRPKDVPDEDWVTLTGCLERLRAWAEANA